jgi:hypothetical protein
VYSVRKTNIDIIVSMQWQMAQVRGTTAHRRCESPKKAELEHTGDGAVCQDGSVLTECHCVQMQADLAMTGEPLDSYLGLLHNFIISAWFMHAYTAWNLLSWCMHDVIDTMPMGLTSGLRPSMFLTMPTTLSQLVRTPFAWLSHSFASCSQSDAKCWTRSCAGASFALSSRVLHKHLRKKYALSRLRSQAVRTSHANTQDVIPAALRVQDFASGSQTVRIVFAHASQTQHVLKCQCHAAGSMPCC